jgi:hypothetical protein
MAWYFVKHRDIFTYMLVVDNNFIGRNHIASPPHMYYIVQQCMLLPVLIYASQYVPAQFGRGAKKDIRSATATTTKMIGKLNLRVLHGGAATLHSIKVMQPKQVSIKTL